MKYRDITINFKMHAEKYEDIQCYAGQEDLLPENNTVQLRL